MNLTFLMSIFYPLFYFFFIIDYIRTFYPEYFNTLFVKLALVSIRLFSRGELFYIKSKRVLSKKYITLLESKVINLNTLKIIKLKKLKLKNILNLNELDLKIFKSAGLEIICQTANDL